MTLPHLPAIPAVLAPFLPALLALAVAGLGAMIARGPVWAAVPGALGTLLGWAALLPAPVLLRASVQPRAPGDHLLLPAAAVLLLAAAGPRLRGRVALWAPVLAVGFAGWWLAQSLDGRAQFWRVWGVVPVLAWLLICGVDGRASRAWGAALALAGGLLIAAAPAGLRMAALVPLAAWTPAAMRGVPVGPAPALLLAVAVAVVDLALGGLARRVVNGTDLLCAAVLATPWLARLLALRPGGRTGATAPVLAAALAVGLAWTGTYLLRR